MKKNTILLLSILVQTLIQSCVSSGGYQKTVQKIDLHKFMGSWYVISSRPTFLEKDAFNAVETYTLLDNGVDIDIDFKFNKNSFDGPVKSIPQSGSVYNKETNSHWKVSPFWPLSFDYLIIATDPEHSWAAIGVPNQKYLWILARQATMNDEKLSSILASLAADGYDVSDMKRVLHKSKD